ncbi:MAG: oxidoreductase [Actinomycetota bacterium]
MSKWSEADIPDQSGRVALVTGANSGLGYETARALAEHGAHVVMACRNPTKAAEAAARIDALEPAGSVEVLLTDMGDLDSVAGSAAQFAASHDTLDILVNNAGLMATPPGRTAQGFDMQLGVNHLGHFALTAPLLPLLFAAGEGSRIVNVSSTGHRMGSMDFEDLHFDRRRYSPWPAYFQSKLANLLFTRGLHERLTARGRPTLAVSAHPGGSRTELGKEHGGGLLANVFRFTRPVLDRTMSQSAAMGALPQLYAAVAPGVEGNDYYGPDGIGEMRGHPKNVGMTKAARSHEDAEQLWELSLEATGADYSALD